MKRQPRKRAFLHTKLTFIDDVQQLHGGLAQRVTSPAMHWDDAVCTVHTKWLRGQQIGMGNASPRLAQTWARVLVRHVNEEENPQTLVWLNLDGQEHLSASRLLHTPAEPKPSTWEVGWSSAFVTTQHKHSISDLNVIWDTQMRCRCQTLNYYNTSEFDLIKRSFTATQFWHIIYNSCTVHKLITLLMAQTTKQSGLKGIRRNSFISVSLL